MANEETPGIPLNIKCPKCEGEISLFRCPHCDETPYEGDGVNVHLKGGCGKPEEFYHLRCPNDDDHKWHTEIELDAEREDNNP